MEWELYSSCEMLSHLKLYHSSVFDYIFHYCLFYLLFFLLPSEELKFPRKFYWSDKDYIDIYKSHLCNFTFI